MVTNWLKNLKSLPQFGASEGPLGWIEWVVGARIEAARGVSERWNADLAPMPDDPRTWTAWHPVALCIGMGGVHSRPAAVIGMAWSGISPVQLASFALFWALHLVFIVRGAESVRSTETITAPIKVLIGTSCCSCPRRAAASRCACRVER